jgi:hypothetical protein
MPSPVDAAGLVPRSACARSGSGDKRSSAAQALAAQDSGAAALVIVNTEEGVFVPGDPAGQVIFVRQGPFVQRPRRTARAGTGRGNVGTACIVRDSTHCLPRRPAMGLWVFQWSSSACRTRHPSSMALSTPLDLLP